MILLLPLSLACVASRSDPSSSDTVGLGSPALESSPLETVPPDTGPTPQTAPGLADLECAEAPPAVGKVVCTLTITDRDGTVEWAGPAGVGLHGRSSMDFPKKQFVVALQDAGGAEVQANLYGMGKGSDWILNGMYIDRALFRNRLGFDLYRLLTGDREWAPQSMYVELTYGGQYWGVYLLEERVQHSKYRVPVPDDDGTGTNFIVRADESGIPSALQYGSWDIIYPGSSNQTAAVVAGVTARMGAAETAIAAEDASTWSQVDLDSAAAFVLLEELFKNNDGYYLSHHLYTASDGLLHFVPWDLDLTLGQPNYNDNENPHSWILYRPAFIADLGAAPGFSDRLSSMWSEWRAGAISDANMDVELAANPAFLGDAATRNFDRWPIADVQWQGYLYTVTSYDDELARVATFVHARLTWMDAHVATWASGP